MVPEGPVPMQHLFPSLSACTPLVPLACSSLEPILPAQWDGGFCQMKDSQALLAEGSGSSNAITIFTSVINDLIFTPLVVLSSLILFIKVQKRPPQQVPE